MHMSRTMTHEPWTWDVTQQMWGHWPDQPKLNWNWPQAWAKPELHILTMGEAPLGWSMLKGQSWPDMFITKGYTYFANGLGLSLTFRSVGCIQTSIFGSTAKWAGYGQASNWLMNTPTSNPGSQEIDSINLLLFSDYIMWKTLIWCSNFDRSS